MPSSVDPPNDQFAVSELALELWGTQANVLDVLDSCTEYTERYVEQEFNSGNLPTLLEKLHEWEGLVRCRFCNVWYYEEAEKHEC